MQVNTNSVNLSNDEILALIKLIFYIKFESGDSELLIYAGSPLVNSALEKMLSNHPFYKNRFKDFGKINQDSLGFVMSKIENDNQDSKLDSEILKELISNCIFPYQIK